VWAVLAELFEGAILLKIRCLDTQNFAVLLIVLVAMTFAGCVGSVQPSKVPSSQPLSISTTVLPGGQAGQPYQAAMVGIGGTPPYLLVALLGHSSHRTHCELRFRSDFRSAH